VGVENRIRGHVEGASHLARDGQAIGLGDVVGVHHLEAEPRQVRDDRDVPGEEAREEPTGEQAALLLARLALEDQTGPQTNRPNLRVLLLEAVEPPLDLRFVARVEARWGSVRRPAFVDVTILRTGR